MGQDNSNTANAGLAVSLPLFAPSVYKAMSMTKTDIELAVEKSRASKQDLVNQVTKAYYQLIFSIGNIKIIFCQFIAFLHYLIGILRQHQLVIRLCHLINQILFLSS